MKGLLMPAERVLHEMLMTKMKNFPECVVAGGDGVTRFLKPFGKDLGGLRSAASIYHKIQDIRRANAELPIPVDGV